MRKILLIISILLFSVMVSAQTSRFQRNFTKTDGTALTGFTGYIYLVPQANTYPTGALALTEDGTRPGVYYRLNVADGEYKIYIDADKGGANPPTIFIENYWVGEQRLSVIGNHFDAADSYRLKSTGIKDGAVTNSKILDGAVTNSKLGTNSVTADKINDASVTNSKIFDLSVNTPKIDWGAVTSGKILDANVTLPKLSQTVLDYINAAGGGTITNLPDDVTLETKPGSTIGIKDSWLTAERLRGKTVLIEDYIGALDTSLGWSLVIQAAVDANLGKGNNLAFLSNKTYSLQKQKDNPYATDASDCCIDLKTGGLSLIIPPGTSLVLKNAQQTDAAGPIDILVFQYAHELYIGGGGRIMGNTVGQTGWTGGYSQTGVNGAIIEGFSPAGIRSNNFVLIENLRLDDHWSCPVNISGGNNIVLKNLSTYGTGEGFQFINVWYSLIDNLIVNDSTNVSVGDGIELSICQYFNIQNCIVKNNGAGTAFDIYGSKNGTLSTFVIEDYGGGGISIASTGTWGTTTDDVVVSNGVIKRIASTGIYANGGGESRVTYNNVYIDSCVIGIQVSDTSAAKAFINGCAITNCSGAGILISGNRKVYITGGSYIHNANGIQITRTNAGKNPEINISGVNVSDNTNYGIFFDSQGDGSWLPTGNISGCNITNNTTADIAGTTSQITGSGNSLAKKLINSSSQNVTGAAYAYINSGFAFSTLTAGLKNQIVTIEFIVPAGSQYEVRDMRVYGSGNIRLYRAENFYGLNGDRITLQWQPDSSYWYEVSRSYNKLIGGNLFVVDGWTQDNVTTSQTNVQLYRFNGTNVMTARFYVPNDAYLRKFTVTSTEARTAGTLTAKLFVDGVEWKTISLDGTNTTTNTTYYGRANTTFAEGNYIDMRLTTTSDWAPTTADITVWMEIEY